MDKTEDAAQTYQAYLLRLWREGTEAPWRASVRGAGMQHEQHFASLEALVAFLGRQLEGEADTPVQEA